MNTSKAKILVVDDQPMIGRSLVRYLLGNGYEAQMRTSPASVTPEDYEWADAVITDWDMPAGGGARIIDEATNYGIPWVVMTGNDQILDTMRKMRVFFVEKPTSLAEILKVIQSALAAEWPDVEAVRTYFVAQEARQYFDNKRDTELDTISCVFDATTERYSVCDGHHRCRCDDAASSKGGAA